MEIREYVELPSEIASWFTSWFNNKNSTSEPKYMRVVRNSEKEEYYFKACTYISQKEGKSRYLIVVNALGHVVSPDIGSVIIQYYNSSSNRMRALFHSTNSHVSPDITSRYGEVTRVRRVSKANRNPDFIYYEADGSIDDKSKDTDYDISNRNKAYPFDFPEGFCDSMISANQEKNNRELREMIDEINAATGKGLSWRDFIVCESLICRESLRCVCRKTDCDLDHNPSLAERFNEEEWKFPSSRREASYLDKTRLFLIHKTCNRHRNTVRYDQDKINKMRTD